MISEGQKLKKIRDAELRRKDREVLRHLREQIRTHGAKRRARLAEIRAHCQAARAALRARARELRARLRSRIARLRAEQCAACSSGRARAKDELKAELARLRAELAAEVRAYRERYVKRSSSSARVREQESADEVAQNLPPELVAVWRVMQSKIKGSARRSRTEAFLDWAEENPDAVHGVLYEQADRDVARLVREHEQAERRVRKTKYSKTDRAAALAAVPF